MVTALAKRKLVESVIRMDSFDRSMYTSADLCSKCIKEIVARA